MCLRKDFSRNWISERQVPKHVPFEILSQSNLIQSTSPMTPSRKTSAKEFTNLQWQPTRLRTRNLPTAIQGRLNARICIWRCVGNSTSLTWQVNQITLNWRIHDHESMMARTHTFPVMQTHLQLKMIHTIMSTLQRSEISVMQKIRI